MPVYAPGSSTNLVTALYPGDSATVWSAENPATGSASQQVAIAGSFGENGPPYCSVEVSFSASPGSFEIDIQEADTDAAVNYLGPLGGGITSTTHNGSVYVVRVDLNNPVTAQFLRLNMTTAPSYSMGSPTVTARIIRR